MTDREAFEKWRMKSLPTPIQIFDEHIKPLLDALEKIAPNAPTEAMKTRWRIPSLISVIELDAETAAKALAEWRKKVNNA